MGEALPPVVERMYDVTRWVIAKAGTFPRDQRFLLGQRIVNVCLDVLEGLIEAAFLPAGEDKAARLRALNSRMDVLRYLLRLALAGRSTIPTIRGSEHHAIDRRRRHVAVRVAPVGTTRWIDAQGCASLPHRAGRRAGGDRTTAG